MLQHVNIVIQGKPLQLLSFRKEITTSLTPVRRTVSAARS